MLRRVELAAAARIRGGGGGGAAAAEKKSQTGKKRQEHAAGEAKGEFCFSQKKGSRGRKEGIFFLTGISRALVFESNVTLNFDKCWKKKVDVAQEE